MKKFFFTDFPYIVMLLPGVIFLIIFNIAPIIGILAAFQNFSGAAGIFHSPFIGFQNFIVLFSMPEFFQVILNTLIISIPKLILNLIIPVLLVFLLTVSPGRKFKRIFQTIVYLPNFLPWLLIGFVFIDFFSISGLANNFLGAAEPIPFIESNTWFRPIIILTDLWKTFGYSAVVYISATISINSNLYAAAELDGANRFQKMLNITLPGILPVIIVMGFMAIGNVFNAGLEQLIVMYNPSVNATGNIIDTFIYQLAFGSSGTYQFGVAAAASFLKSIFNFGLLFLGYKLAKRFADYSIL